MDFSVYIKNEQVTNCSVIDFIFSLKHHDLMQIAFIYVDLKNEKEIINIIHRAVNRGQICYRFYHHLFLKFAIIPDR